MGDLVHHLTLCAAVHCLRPHSAERHVAQASSSVPDLIDLHRTSQTWIPYGTYFRRVHRISGYGRPCVPLSLLLRSTCSTQRYGSMLWSIVLYLVRPPQDLTDLDTIWDLLQEGP